LHVAAFVALFDAGLLPRPEAIVAIEDYH